MFLGIALYTALNTTYFSSHGYLLRIHEVYHSNLHNNVLNMNHFNENMYKSFVSNRINSGLSQFRIHGAFIYNINNTCTRSVSHREQLVIYRALEFECKQ